MKVLMVNGSAHENGCTFTALTEVGETLKSLGIDYEIFQIGNKPFRECISCGGCKTPENNGKGCVFNDDIVNEFSEKAYEADGFVFGSPVYYGHPSGNLLSFMDRLSFSTWDGAVYKPFMFKPAAAVVSARRGGTTASLDCLQKHFGNTQMITIGSTYWPLVHGMTPDEVKKDEEGLQAMRNLARNMAWLIKCINAGKEKGIALPETEAKYVTNFIR